MKQKKYDKYNSLELRTQNWINESNKAHNNKFDYSKAVYVNSRTKVEIICPKHDNFFQRSTDHKLSKHGCPKCGQDSNVKILRKNGVHKESGRRLNKSLTEEQRKENGRKNKETRIKNGYIISDEDIGEWELYKRQVRNATENQDLSKLPNISKRAFGPNNYNLDHMYSRINGFKNNISPEIIGHISNLRMILFEDNRKKYTKSCITLTELYKRIENDTVE